MTEQSFHDKSIDQVVSYFKTDSSEGLSDEEAQRRLEEYGYNVLKKKKQQSAWQILLEQFTTPLVWLLIAAGLLAFIFQQIPEGIAIVVVIVINTAIGFFMEWQAVRSMDELLKMGRAKTKVIRNGAVKTVDSALLVPGDLVFLEAGDLVTADARLIEEHNLAVKEAALTGESVQESKQTAELPEDIVLADRTNSVFKGTVVTRGNAKAIVVATANQTELGRISGLTQEAKKETTPLDRRLNDLSKRLIWLTLAITVLILISGVIRGREWMIMIETAIALAVAAIPEGLPVIATITLARGMVRLSKKKAIVKSLEAVQTLGETNVIITDKTGTLTENEMYLDQIVLRSGHIEIADFKGEIEDRAEEHQSGLELFLTTAVLCNDSNLVEGGDGSGSTGDPIEVALLRSAQDILGDLNTLKEQYPRLAEVPFDADIKMMATAHRHQSEFLVCVKGATEVVLEKCTHELNEQGEEVDFHQRDSWLKKTDDLAGEGYRVLSFAYRQSKEEPDGQNFIHDLVFLGLGCFIDPARIEVKEAVRLCQDAGIKVIMVTGDHAETAANIAEEVGLVENRKGAVKIHGQDLLSHKQHEPGYLERVMKSHIFARTNPAQKLHLVQLYQQNNYIVGMTGDGVNDAPALKKANIGIAMGQRGTEAAKEVADIILKDDSFSSIVLAIKQGRIIFENIRMFVVYLLSCNLSEILVVGTASFLGIPLPLLPLQILFLNMVTDVFPALALGMSEGEEGVMKAPPRAANEPVITKNLWIALISYGVGMTVAVLGIEFVGLYMLHLPDIQVNNMTFYTLILVQLWNVFNLPGAGVSFFRNAVTKNKYVWWAILLSIVIVAVSWMILPVREALSLTPLEPAAWGLILAFSVIPVVLIQFFKRVLKIIH